ncbi:signal peptidase I [Candidatus Uhrbacteria bacterium]|nr:signal peptidase I [Candidatus Uhrbacteria bacterium]
MKFSLFRPKYDAEGKAIKASGLSFVFELIQVLAISLAIIIPVRYFLIQPFYVKGASMEPNFYDHEYLLIDEISYRFHDPHRGDIIVFRYPKDPSQFFIKRVIGLPGETVEIKENKIRVYNDAYPTGQIVDENAYLAPGEKTSAAETMTLKSDEYFVLGDNRPMSYDSRFFGPLKRSDITGRVWLRGYPLDRWKEFKTPVYNL